MTRWGMVIDLDKCTACQACVVACQEENNVPVVEAPEYHRRRALSWMKVISETEGHYPELRTRFIPRPCMQCDNPPCTRVCPVHATYLTSEGIVAQVYGRCIGCRFCMAGCPYGSRSFNYLDPRSALDQLDPNYPTREIGVVEKCNFCAERIDVGEGPACVASCKTGVLTFGNLHDPDSDIRGKLKTRVTFTRKPELGTRPSVFYAFENGND